MRGDAVTTIHSTVKPKVKLGVMNARSVANKLDYVFDHIIDNNLDIVALTETWLSNEEVNNRRVVMECSTHGFTLHHVPRNSGRTGGGVGVLINDRVKLVTRLEPINNAVSFESMEMIITIVSISIRLVVIYRMPPSKKNKLKRGTFVTEFSDYLEKLSCLRGNLIIVGDFNINWLDTSDSERRNLFNILETFGLVQRIELPTYHNGNLLDYNIVLLPDSPMILWCPTKFLTIWRYMHHYHVSALILRGNKFLFELYAV